MDKNCNVRKVCRYCTKRIKGPILTVSLNERKCQDTQRNPIRPNKSCLQTASKVLEKHTCTIFTPDTKIIMYKDHAFLTMCPPMSSFYVFSNILIICQCYFVCYFSLIRFEKEDSQGKTWL